MPLQILMMMLLITIIFPLMILTSNNEVFFIVISLVLLFSSIRSLYELLFIGNNQTDSPEQDAGSEELEEFIGLDVKKLETGFRFVKNFIVLLYLTYCSFYIHITWIKYFIFAIALYWIYDIILFMQNKKVRKTDLSLMNIIVLSIVNIATISIVIYTTFSKFIIYNL